MKYTAYPSTKQSIGIAAFCFVSMIIFIPLNIFLNETTSESISMMIYYLLTMSAPFLIFHFLKKKNEGSVSYQFKPKDMFVVLLICLATIAIQWGVTMPIANLIPMPDSIAELFKEMSLKMKDVYGLITVTVLAPLFEELIFRGIILDGLLQRRSKWSAIIIASILFGIVHLNPWQFVSAFIIGIFSGWVYYRTRSLSYSILVHFTNNFIASVLFYFDETGETMDMELVELYGGTSNAIMIISLCILVAIFSIYYLNKRMKVEREVGPPQLSQSEPMEGITSS